MKVQLDDVIKEYGDKPLLYAVLERNFLDFWANSLAHVSNDVGAKQITIMYKKLTENLDDNDYREIALAEISRRNMFKFLKLPNKPSDITVIAFAMIRLYIKDKTIYNQLKLANKEEIDIMELERAMLTTIINVYDEDDDTLFSMLSTLVAVDSILEEIVNGTKDEKLIAKKIKEVKGTLTEQIILMLLDYNKEVVKDVTERWETKVNDAKKDAKERGVSIKRLTRENKELKSEVYDLTRKLSKLSKQEEKEEVYSYEKDYEDAKSEIFILQNKLTNLQERMHYIENSMSGNKEMEELIELQRAIEEEQDSWFNLDDYKVIVVGDSSRLRLSSQFILYDHMKQPNSIGKCDNADAVILLTNFMTHPAFFGVRNYCKKFGINFRYCSVAGTNMSTIESAIRHEVVNLLK